MTDKKAEIREKYELTANIYDSRYEKLQKEKYFGILEDLEIKEPILDLGCGSGLLADILKRKLIGVDISFEMLRKAKKRKVLAVQADLDYLPFKSNVFSSILSFTALQNLPKVEKALQEIKRVSDKDARIVLTYLNKFDFTNQIKKEFEILEVKSLGEDSGFILHSPE